MTIALDGLRGRLLILCAVAASTMLAPAVADAARVSRDANKLYIQEDPPNLGSANEANFIEVTASGPDLVVTDKVPLTPGTGCRGGGALGNEPSTTVRCTESGITSIEVQLGDQKDYLNLSSSTIPDDITSSTVTGDAGDDEIHGLMAGADTIGGGDEGDTIFGSGGADTLSGNGADDTLYGGDGGDTLRGGAGADDFNGGLGTDTVDYQNDGTTGIGASIPDGAAGDGCHGTDGSSCEGDSIRDDVENLTGTTGNDFLEGSSGNNSLTGLGGNDTLYGLDGADTITGSTGDDTVRPGFGNDTVDAGGNTDTVDYTDRNDPLLASSNLTIDLSTSTATAPGEPAETDSISNFENAKSGAGADTLIGNDSSSPGNTLDGGLGNDLLRGKNGPDTLIGGGGTDTVSYVDDADDTSNVVATIGDGQANDGSSTDDGSADNIHADVENLIGGPDDDTLAGSDVPNQLEGAGGNDTLIGKAAADSFFGGLVSDAPNAANGSDTVSYSERSSGVVATLDGTANDGDQSDGGQKDFIDLSIENLTGSGGGDTLTGSAGVNTLNGLAGNDLLRGGLGGDTFLGGDGEDTLDYSSDGRSTGVTVTIGNNNADDGGPTEADSVPSDVENVVGTDFADVISGSSGDNKLYGLALNDQLNGLGGNDSLDGGTGNQDIVNGGPGADVLHGGSTGTGQDGNDTIDGGTGGSDTVTYADAPAPPVFGEVASKGRVAPILASLDNVANDGDIANVENDSINLVENAIGGSGNDILTGHTGAAGVAANTLDGRDGNDTLNGGTEGATPLADVLIGGNGERDLADYSTRSSDDNLTITLDGEANDGEVDENDHIHADVEDVTTAGGQDTVTGETDNDNVIKTQGGNDAVDTRDSNTDDVDCGSGTDTVVADRRDIIVGCETQDLPAQPLVSVSGPASPVNEGGTATFTISIDDITAQTVTVSYATSDETATAGQDYTAKSSTATITAGQTSTTVDVPVLDDALDEDAETFKLTISNPSNATLADGGNVATATITDTDAPPTLSVDDEAPIDEGDTGDKVLAVDVKLSAASAKQVTVKYATSDGTATAGEDYDAANGTLTFAPGETTRTVDVTLLGDTFDEDDETFVVTLTDASNATIADDTGTETIADDDDAPSISIGDASVEEGNAGTANLSFPVTLSAASNKTVEVDYDLSDVTTEPADYVDSSGTVTFQPGQTEATIVVAVNGDSTPEADETFKATLSNPVNATIADAEGIGTITDNDAPSISVNDATVTEGDDGTVNATFTVTLNQASEKEVKVDYSTLSGSASDPADFTDTDGTLTFAPGGATTQQVAVPVKGDTLDEPDETFTLELSKAENATIDDGTGVGTITDDDATPSLSVANAEQTESDDAAKDLTFTVTLSAASGREVTVKYATADGSAKAGEDYTATTGTLTIPAGQTSGEVKVPVLGDKTVEPDETLTLTLSEPSNATIAEGKGAATGTIKTDNDAGPDEGPPPSLSVADVKVAEGDTGTTPAVFTVTLSKAAKGAVTVFYATADNTATASRDYQSASGTLTFAAGELTKTVSVSIIGDKADESDETFGLVLSGPTGATLQKAVGAGLITDDETPRLVPRVTARTTPSRDRALPYRFTTTGRLTPPSGVRRADACAGKVQIRFKAGSKTISTRRVNLRRDCTFSRRVSFGIKSRLKPGRLKVEVRFLGNAVLLPKSARTRFVRAG